MHAALWLALVLGLGGAMGMVLYRHQPPTPGEERGGPVATLSGDRAPAPPKAALPITATPAAVRTEKPRLFAPADPKAPVQVLAMRTDGFTHPGIGITREMLENAYVQLQQRREPWYSGFQRMAAAKESAKTVSCRNQSLRDLDQPDATGIADRSTVARLAGDGKKALNQALMYVFTGEEQYRENGMHIVRVWSHLDAQKTQPFAECYIHASGPVMTMIEAAEILRYTSAGRPALAWTQRDTDDFTANFVVPCLARLFDTNTHFMNQDGYPKMATIAGDIFTGNRRDYDKRVEMFTVNRDAPDQGFCFSIKRLARLVERDDGTGKTVPAQVQLIEMGRDQAHAGDDVEIFGEIARMLNAQGTTVDPVAGTVSTAADAVGPYEFLSDRILAANEAFFGFMLGYETPWTPTASSITGGTINAVYPRIADNYRGRIRQFAYWDAYYHYSCVRGMDVAQLAPRFAEAFARRINEPDTDWIQVPGNVSGVGAKPMSLPRLPGTLNLDQHITALDGKTTIVREDDRVLVRMKPDGQGVRIALLGGATDQKTILMRVRTDAPLEFRMTGFTRPWLLPDTGGEWRTIAYRLEALERLGDIVFCTVTGREGSRLDADWLNIQSDGRECPRFTTGDVALQRVACVGIPLVLDLSAGGGAAPVVVSGDTLPAGAALSQAGAFAWTPRQAGDTTFRVTATSGEIMTTRQIVITVEADRSAALQRASSAYQPGTAYVAATLTDVMHWRERFSVASGTLPDREFSAGLQDLQAAVAKLEPLTPLLADGSMDFPRLVTSSTLGANLSVLTDGNDDTFAGLSPANGPGHTVDFGEHFRFSATAFAIQGRLNFADRAQGVVFSGSNDGATWTQLTARLEDVPVAVVKIAAGGDGNGQRFRYLNIRKTGRSSPLLEFAEIRIFGQRYELPGH